MGGLFSGLYCIGAVSSLGKTSFVLQLADQIAESGKDVLIFSLEMAKRELIAKSLSRKYYERYRDIKDGVTARDILSYRGSVQYKNKSKLLSIIDTYKNVAKNLYIVENTEDISANDIDNIVKQHIEATGNHPVVIIDYLQLIMPDNSKLAYDRLGIEETITRLKRISRTYDIPLVVISSFNRNAYANSPSMSSFNGSGKIEYSSDILLSMEYRIQQNENITERQQLIEKSKDEIQINLVVLKNRNGRPGTCVNLTFVPRYNYFYEFLNLNINNK